MLATERLLEIREQFAAVVQRLVAVDLDGGMLQLILYLKDGTNLRVTEQWQGKTIKRYSYYWLTATNEMKIGWDNAPLLSQTPCLFAEVYPQIPVNPSIFKRSEVE